MNIAALFAARSLHESQVFSIWPPSTFCTDIWVTFSNFLSISLQFDTTTLSPMIGYQNFGKKCSIIEWLMCPFSKPLTRENGQRCGKRCSGARSPPAGPGVCRALPVPNRRCASLIITVHDRQYWGGNMWH